MNTFGHFLLTRFNAPQKSAAPAEPSGKPLGLDAPWLARIEAASRAQPGDARLLYLSALACMHRELWGKARQLLAQAAPQLADPALRANAWRALAALAEQQGDDSAAAQAWKQAALSQD